MNGFTLPELLAVIAIIAILALCVMRAATGATSRADVARCMGNLRGLHIALATDLTEKGHWPQCPFELGKGGYDDWWVHELSAYKISEANWTCPTIQREMHASKQDFTNGLSKIHYVPVDFDDNPFTPRRWTTQPWIIEIADAHGEGNLMVFPDGAIIGATRYLNQQQP